MREIVSKIQTMRKDTDFEVTDRIKVYSDGNEKIADIISRNLDYISGQVLADEFVSGVCENSKDWNINGENVKLGVERV